MVTAQYKGNVSALSRALGFSQSMVSEFLQGTRGAGPKLLGAIATLTGQTIDAVLGRSELRASEPEDPLPERHAAAVWARAHGVREDAIRDIVTRDQSSSRRLTPDEWYGRMTSRAWELDEADAGRGREPGRVAADEIPEPPKKRKR